MQDGTPRVAITEYEPRKFIAVGGIDKCAKTLERSLEDMEKGRVKIGSVTAIRTQIWQLPSRLWSIAIMILISRSLVSSHAALLPSKANDEAFSLVSLMPSITANPSEQLFPITRKGDAGGYSSPVPKPLYRAASLAVESNIFNAHFLL